MLKCGFDQVAYGLLAEHGVEAGGVVGGEIEASVAELAKTGEVVHALAKKLVAATSFAKLDLSAQ